MIFKNGIKSKIEPLKESVFRKSHIHVKGFVPKVKIFIERERYIIKTAENNEDLIKALKLRHEVFYKELLNKNLFLGIDYDRFDLKCDHLILIDKRTGKFFATYRFNSSKFTKKFYSATEFTLDRVNALGGNKLELGRACVHHDYRNGLSVALLWRGLTEYMKATDTRYCFGCSSVMTTDKNDIAAIHKVLMKTSPGPEDLKIRGKGKFKIRNFRALVDAVTPEDEQRVADMVPPLIKLYTNMGATICGEPAFDKKFKCVDYFTFFDLDKPNMFKKKFMV